jgi:hypothetical protein
LYAFLIIPMCTTCPTHFILLEFYCSSNCWSLYIMKLLIMQSSPAFCHFLHLRSKYSPQHTVLKYPQSMYLL